MVETLIEPVRNKQQLRAFVAFPWKIYKGDPYWVPPFFRERMQFFDPRKNPFFEHAEVQLFLARREGQVVGTVAAIINHNHNAFHNDKVAFFGHFECINDQEVASALLTAASDWVRARGMEVIRGPMNMSTNDECGLLIDGFDSAPVAMMTYNPPYYERLITSNGFEKAMDLYAWLISTDVYDRNVNNMPRKVLASCKKLEREGEITIREASLAKFSEEMTRAKQVYNSAWGRNWGFVPATDAEIEHLANGLRRFLDPEMVFFAEDNGKPVGISVAIPDVNETLLRIYPKPGGTLRYVYDGLRFLWAKRRRPRLIRLLIMGVVEGYRGRGIDACFYVHSARKAFAKGYRECEMSWILETNTMMNRIIERLGGHIYKTYRIYDKAL
ncbi:MAG: N-acetyltransferase [Anaerolineae bacterium]